MAGPDSRVANGGSGSGSRLWVWVLWRGAFTISLVCYGIWCWLRVRPGVLRRQDIRPWYEIMFHAIVRFAFFAVMGTGFMLLILAAFQLGYYRFTPMEWWVNYQSITVIGQGSNASIFINRTISTAEPLPVRIYSELHGKLYDRNQLDQYCESSTLVTAEPDTGPLVKVPIRDILRPTCAYDKLPCEPMQLQVIVEIALPMSVMKRKRFLSEPYYPSDNCGGVRVSPIEFPTRMLEMNEWDGENINDYLGNPG